MARVGGLNLVSIPWNASDIACSGFQPPPPPPPPPPPRAVIYIMQSRCCCLAPAALCTLTIGYRPTQDAVQATMAVTNIERFPIKRSQCSIFGPLACTMKRLPHIVRPDSTHSCMQAPGLYRHVACRHLSMSQDTASLFGIQIPWMTQVGRSKIIGNNSDCIEGESATVSAEVSVEAFCHLAARFCCLPALISKSLKFYLVSLMLENPFEGKEEPLPKVIWTLQGKVPQYQGDPTADDMRADPGQALTAAPPPSKPAVPDLEASGWGADHASSLRGLSITAAPPLPDAHGHRGTYSSLT